MMSSRFHQLRIRGQAGFTLIEVVVAATVMLVGIVAAFGVLDSSGRANSAAGRQEIAAHVGEQEIERLLALSYSALALSANPAPSSTVPFSYVLTPGSGTCPGSSTTNCFEYNQRPTLSTASESLVVTSTGGAGTAGPTAWSYTSGSNQAVTGQLYRFVTWVTDSISGKAQAYKRITVEVTVDKHPPNQPIVLSAVATDPSS